MAVENLEGKIGFYTEIKITPSEIGTWEPERIAKFFRGLSMVLEAVNHHNSPSVKLMAKFPALDPDWPQEKQAE